MVFDWLHKKNADYIMRESLYENDELLQLSNYFNLEINHRVFDKDKYTQLQGIFNIKSDKQQKVDEHIIYIQQLANKYLEMAGLKQNTNHFMIEFWRYRISAERRRHIFSIHCDSWTDLGVPVNTCIFYLRKDKTFYGGDLQLNGKYFQFDNRNSCVISTSPEKIIVFDGDTYHKVLPFSGFGIRDCIVVQFEKERKKEIQLFGTKFCYEWN